MTGPSDQAASTIHVGDKVTRCGSDTRQAGDVTYLTPICTGFPGAGTMSVSFDLAWVSWNGKKKLERVSDLIILTAA